MQKVKIAGIGAGPANLSFFQQASEDDFDGDAVLFEEKAHVGGEGALSDGKFKTSEEFSTMRRRGSWSYVMQQQNHDRFFRMFLKTGVPYREEPNPSDRMRKKSFYDRESARIADRGLQNFEIRRENGTTLHVGTDNLRQYVNSIVDMISRKVEILCDHRVDDICPTEHGTFVISGNDGSFAIEAETVAMAPGRRKTPWFFRVMKALGAQTFRDHDLIGGRVTVPATSVWPEDAGVIAPCYRECSKPPTFNFCTCERGYLHRNSKMEFLDDHGRPVELVTVNGFSCAKKKSELTNWALLTEVRQSEPPDMSTARILQDFVARVNDHNTDPRKKTVECDLRGMVLGKHDALLTHLFPGETFQRIKGWMQKMALLYQDTLDSSSRLVLPEVKLRGERVLTDEKLHPIGRDHRPIRNVYVIGDAGVGTNLYDAHIQGHCAGNDYAERSRS